MRTCRGRSRCSPASPRRSARTAPATATRRKLSEALTSLGPSYIKLGQFLATRDDIIGRELARDLSTLQDRLPPFSQGEARAAVEEALGAPIDTALCRVRPAGRRRLDRAGAQGARCAMPDGTLKPVAVKVLRPGIEQRFQKDLD